ncbi:MAG: hypothetical protein KJ607_05965 [Bacteroidetes bacterium]|nr:hypothetical protein [Bacteroidota bacterium]
MKLSANISVCLLAIILLNSCSKTEGEGGMAAITGTVKLRTYSPGFRNILNEYYAPDVEVYIIYGDEVSYGDRIRTNFDGTYIFRYLRPGDYTIFTYSEDTSLTTGVDVPVSRQITISGKKDEVVADVIVIADELDYDDGNSSICGRVYYINYQQDLYFVPDVEYFIPDQDVYIIYGDEQTYFERTRTLADGSYCFTNLIKGHYTVFAYSEDSTFTSPSGIIAVEREADIEHDNQHIDLNVIRILD